MPVKRLCGEFARVYTTVKIIQGRRLGGGEEEGCFADKGNQCPCIGTYTDMRFVRSSCFKAVHVLFDNWMYVLEILRAGAEESGSR